MFYCIMFTDPKALGRGASGGERGAMEKGASMAEVNLAKMALGTLLWDLWLFTYECGEANEAAHHAERIDVRPLEERARSICAEIERRFAEQTAKIEVLEGALSNLHPRSAGDSAESLNARLDQLAVQVEELSHRVDALAERLVAHEDDNPRFD